MEGKETIYLDGMSNFAIHIYDRFFLRRPIKICCPNCKSVGYVKTEYRKLLKVVGVYPKRTYQVKEFECRCEKCRSLISVCGGSVVQTYKGFTFYMILILKFFSIVFTAVSTCCFVWVMLSYGWAGDINDSNNGFMVTLVLGTPLLVLFLGYLMDRYPYVKYREDEPLIFMDFTNGNGLQVIEKEVEVVKEVDKWQNKQLFFNSDYQVNKGLFPYEEHLKQYLWNNLTLLLHKDLTIQHKHMEYRTKVGPIDILLIDQFNNAFVIELKRRSSPDKVVGQVQRYMTAIREKMPELNNIVGVIITGAKDEKLIYSAAQNPNIRVFEYGINAELICHSL